MVARKPRVVIIGAGMAGLSAASQLQRFCYGASPYFEITVLEASQRIGGRIHTTRFGGNQVELGATWIHGIQGSPIYNIAKGINALNGDIIWERQDGFPAEPVMRTEGGFTVDPALIEAPAHLYKKLMYKIRDAAASKERERQKYGRYESVGDFLKESVNTFLSQQTCLTQIEKRILSRKTTECINIANGWSLKSLQDSVFSMHKNMERITTATNSLFDLDMESEKEYREYPGEHLTIGKGYGSVLQELASSLPPGAIKFGKKVSRCFWNHSQVSSDAPVVVHCTDGFAIEADHVIITVSLGVLKAGCLSSATIDLCLDAGQQRSVCRSVHEL